jgi:hypothetical protein
MPSGAGIPSSTDRRYATTVPGGSRRLWRLVGVAPVSLRILNDRPALATDSLRSRPGDCTSWHNLLALPAMTEPKAPRTVVDELMARLAEELRSGDRQLGPSSEELREAARLTRTALNSLGRAVERLLLVAGVGEAAIVGTPTHAPEVHDGAYKVGVARKLMEALERLTVPTILRQPFKARESRIQGTGYTDTLTLNFEQATALCDFVERSKPDLKDYKNVGLVLKQLAEQGIRPHAIR